MVETGAGVSDDEISAGEDENTPGVVSVRAEVIRGPGDDSEREEAAAMSEEPPQLIPLGDETGEAYAPPAEAADTDSPVASPSPTRGEAPANTRPSQGPDQPRPLLRGPHPFGAPEGAARGGHVRSDSSDNDDEGSDDDWDDVEFDAGEDDEAVVLRVICAGRVSTAGAEGECYSHARQCGAGSACYLMLRSTRTSVIRGSRAHSAPSLYLDAHGEEDLYMRRGCPLFLNRQRYDQLRALYRTASFDYDTKALDRTLSNASYH
jgi:hypothetical protein